MMKRKKKKKKKMKRKKKKKMKRKKKKMKRSPCRGLSQSSFSIVSNLVKGPRVPFPVAGTTMTEIPSLSQHLRDQNLSVGKESRR